MSAGSGPVEEGELALCSHRGQLCRGFLGFPNENKSIFLHVRMMYHSRKRQAEGVEPCPGDHKQQGWLSGPSLMHFGFLKGKHRFELPITHWCSSSQAIDQRGWHSHESLTFSGSSLVITAAPQSSLLVTFIPRSHSRLFMQFTDYCYNLDEKFFIRLSLRLFQTLQGNL